MKYSLEKSKDTYKVSKIGIELSVFKDADGVGIVLGETKEGHNQKFFHKKSTFHYLILEGSADFYLDEEKVSVKEGDLLSIKPNTEIYYKGNMKFALLTTPPWTQEEEVITQEKIW